MRNISFSITAGQFIAKRKLVTRRVGWVEIRPGELLQGVKKCQGLRKGETVERLGVIRVVRVRREPLRKIIDLPYYGRLEMILEGFPDMKPEEFVEMFCKSHKNVTPESEVTRIQYEYI